MKPKHPAGSPMTLGNLRELGVHHLIAYCLDDACLHSERIDAWRYSGDVQVQSLSRRAVCGKCGGKRVDVRPNWRERPQSENLTEEHLQTANRENTRISIGTLTKTLGILAVAAVLVGLLAYMQKPAAPIAQKAAIQATPTTAVSKPDTNPWIAALSAVGECKAKRLSGELKTYVESATCSNPNIVQAFSAANYKHMDLIQAFAAKRLELAEKLDRQQISEAQSDRELSEFSNRIRNEERQ
jgi:hypothetical protein